MSTPEQPEHVRYTQAVIAGEAIKHADAALRASHEIDQSAEEAIALASKLTEQLRAAAEELKTAEAERDRLGAEITRLNGELSQRVNALSAELHEQRVNYSLVLQRETEERQAGARARALARALAQNTHRTHLGLQQIAQVLESCGVAEQAPSLVALINNLDVAQGVALGWAQRDLPADESERN